jgi:hypothetical protein
MVKGMGEWEWRVWSVGKNRTRGVLCQGWVEPWLNTHLQSLAPVIPSHPTPFHLHHDLGHAQGEADAQDVPSATKQ